MRVQQIAAIALVAVLLAACSKTTSSASEEPITPVGQRKPAPDFTLKDANGASVKLADYKGKVVLLNFWATWCGPCKLEIPWFMEFEQQYKDRDFAVLGVSFDDDGWKSVRPYIQDHKINYRIMIGSDQIGQLYGGIDALPTSFVIDRQGRIAASHTGLVDKRDYQNEILKLLGDPKQSAERRDASQKSIALLRPAERPSGR
jgi:peroxiredoxin